MAFATTTQMLNKTAPSSSVRSSIYSPVSPPSSSPRCMVPVVAMSRRQESRSKFATNAYRNGCQDNYRRGFAWGPLGMGPDAAMAGAALADMARKFAQSSQGFNQTNMDPTQQQIPLFVDLMETDSQYLLAADVPGLQKSDLKITVNPKERTLKVTGERKRTGEFDKASSDEAQKFRRQFERRIGKFQRTFSMIPDNADLSSVAARVDKGVLTITVQKTASTESDDTMDINIE